MKKINKYIAIALTFTLMFSLTACQSKPPETTDSLELAIYYTGKYLVKEVNNLKYEDEIAVISLLRSNTLEHNDSDVKKYIENITEVLQNSDAEINVDDFVDIVIAHTSTGTTSNILINYISYDNTLLKGGYLNKIRALIAFESGGYIPSSDGDITTEGLVEFILSLQIEDGSFQYKGMSETIIEVTANSVIALSLTDETPEIKTAIEKGVSYLSTRIRQDDTLKDLALVITALNTTGIDATDIEGNNLIEWVLEQEREDFSYNQSQPESKDGNIEDTAYALMAISSQFRFENEMNSYHDMSDVLLAASQSSGNVFSDNIMLVAVISLALIAVLAFVFIKKKQVKKLREEGVYNEKESREMTDEELVQRDIIESKLEDENS